MITKKQLEELQEMTLQQIALETKIRQTKDLIKYCLILLDDIDEIIRKKIVDITDERELLSEKLAFVQYVLNMLNIFNHNLFGFNKSNEDIPPMLKKFFDDIILQRIPFELNELIIEKF